MRRRPEHAVEVAAAAGGALAAAVVMKHAVVADLATRVPKGLRDPLLQTWQLAWGADALARRPLDVWDANAFWPLERSLAFSDALLGYAPFGVLFGSGTRSAVVRYNVLFVLSYAVAAFGAYLLARQLGARRPGAAVAAVAYAFAPWHLAQENHLHVLSTGGVPLSLALLLRAHGIRGRASPAPLRPRLAVVGWLVAAWQISLGFSIGLPFGYLLAGLSIVIGVMLLRRLRADRTDAGLRRLVAADCAGVAVFVVTVAAFAAPYAAVLDDHPEAARTVEAVRYYSPPISGFVVPPAAALVTGDWFDGMRSRLEVPEEMTLAPGMALLGLAAAGLVFSTWPVRARLALGAVAAVALLLALGMSGPGDGALYEPLFRHAPGWEAIRTPGRLVFLVTLALAMLAAAGTDALGAAMRHRLSSRTSLLVAIALVGAVAVEGAGTTPMVRVPASPVDLRAIADPVFFLPSDIILDNRAMFFSVDGFPALVNGNSGFTPRSLDRLRDRTGTFPDDRSVDALCAVGVRTVVVASAWFDPPRRPLDRRAVRALDMTVRPARDAFVFSLGCRR